MWPGFDSLTRRHMCRVEFVVGSLLCSERFFFGYSGFPLSFKTNISKFQFDSGMHGHFWTSSCELLSAPWVNKLHLHLHYITCRRLIDRLKQIGIELVHAILVSARLRNRTSESQGAIPRLTWVLGLQCIARSSVMIRRDCLVHLWVHHQCVLRQMQLLQIRTKESARGHRAKSLKILSRGILLFWTRAKLLKSLLN